MKAALIGLIVTLATSTAFAKDVTCKTIAKVPSVILQYSISNNPSQRLASDITYFSSTGTRIYSFDSVAQHKATTIELFNLVDDAGESPVFQFVALGLNGRNYVGSVSEYNAQGKISKSTAVSCVVQ